MSILIWRVFVSFSVVVLFEVSLIATSEEYGKGKGWLGGGSSSVAPLILGIQTVDRPSNSLVGIATSPTKKLCLRAFCSRLPSRKC